MAGPMKQECPICRGKKEVPCEICHGKGYHETNRPREDAYGRLIYETERNTCTTCHGNKKRMCYACGGEGYNLVPGEPEVDPKVEPDPDDGEVLPRTPEEYAELYRRELESAEQERQELLSWLSSTGEFDPVLKNSYRDAISNLNLVDPKAEADLKATADYLDGLSRTAPEKKLSEMMRRLAFPIGGLDLYRKMQG